MAESRKNGSYRPTTPSQSGNSHPRLLQPLPLQTSAARPISNIGPLSPVNQNGSFAFDRVIKSGNVNRRVKKKGAWKSSWKPAYLVLRPNLLSVYKDQDETELKASITLSDVTAVAPVKKSHHEHVFGIFSPTKNYHFSALSVRETSDWITIIRLEARTEGADDLQMPNASFAQGDALGYETTDASADDEVVMPASPEAPQWTVRGHKRLVPQVHAEPRRISGLAPYSGNESFATSQSDFSDGFSNSAPGNKSYLSASLPHPSALTPIIDDVPSVSRPIFNRGASYLSDTGTATLSQSPLALSRSTPKQTPLHASHTQTSSDPTRVVRQGGVRLSKTMSGVKQWKSIFMVLRLQSLTMYKSNNEATPALVIPTSAIIEAAEIDRKHKQNCFQVIGEEKTYRFQAETEGDLENWLGAFKSVLVKQQESRSRGPSLSLPDTRDQVVGHSAVVPRPGSGHFVMPLSRDGTSVMANQKKNMSLDNQVAAYGNTKRIVSPPAAGIERVSTYSQVTTSAQ